MLKINHGIGKKSEIPGLTILRGLAALFVAIHHFGLLSLHLREATIGPLLSKFGLLGMSLFFVLSGFVINYSYRDAICTSGLTGVKKFLIARIARLAPLYILFVLANFIINCLFLDPSNRTLYLDALPFNLLALQSWFYFKLHGVDIVNTQNLANISWSISTEWLLYLLYLPFAFYMLKGGGSLRRGVLILLFGIFFRVLLIESITNSIIVDGNKFGEWLLYYSPYGRWFEFMSGIGLSEIWLRRDEIGRKMNALVWFLAVSSIIYILFSLFNESIFFIDTLFAGYRAYSGYAITVPFVVLLACKLTTQGKAAIFWAPLLLLGEVSYSIYLLHGDLISIFSISALQTIEENLIRALLFFYWLFFLAIISFRFIEIPGKKLVLNCSSYFSSRNERYSWGRMKIVANFIAENRLILSGLMLVLLSALYVSPSPSYKARIKDLSQIKAALEMYHKDHGSFPLANYSSLVSPKLIINEDWIPSLAPKYIPYLPRDIRKNNIPGQQYLYVSDGRDYKLIAHGVDDAKAVEKIMPDLIDPRRPDMSYGFWSSGAQDW